MYSSLSNSVLCCFRWMGGGLGAWEVLRYESVTNLQFGQDNSTSDGPQVRDKAMTMTIHPSVIGQIVAH